MLISRTVIFAALEFGDYDRFEPGSITQTSVIVVLPLGTLVAQRLANPAWFGTGTGGAPSADSTGLTSSSTSRGGGAASTTSTAKRPLLMSVRSNNGVGGRDSGGGGGVHRGSGHAAVSTHIAAAAATGAASDGPMGSEKGRAVRADRDDGLERNGDWDLERGGPGGGVRVNYGIERREERLPTGGS